MTNLGPYTPINVLHRAYRKADISPVEIVDAELAREDRLEEKLKAYVTRYPDEARSLARAAEQTLQGLGSAPPLLGIPIALKDLVDLKGRITKGGSPERAQRVSPSTAVIADRLMAAGAIVPGKTHTVEMAMGGWGTNEHMGTPWNPWDLETHRTPGGSSSGSGVAVAAGYVAGAIGTDTGGSVRLPAAWCGLVGLKVTEGVLPLEGIIPLSFTLDTPGPMTRSVDDAALMFEVLRGREDAQVNHDLETISGLFAAIRKPLHGLALAVLHQEERSLVDHEILDHYDKSVDCLADLGARIIVQKMPQPFESYAVDAQIIVSSEGYHFNKEILDDDNATVDPWVRRRLIPGKDYTVDKYLAALARRRSKQAEFKKAFAGIDAFLTPATLTPAIPLSDVDQLGTPAHFTRAGNYLALCSLALPNGFTKSGLPSSLMITCHARQEATALQIGKAYEAANNWCTRHPEAID